MSLTAQIRNPGTLGAKSRSPGNLSAATHTSGSLDNIFSFLTDENDVPLLTETDEVLSE